MLLMSAKSHHPLYPYFSAEIRYCGTSPESTANLSASIMYMIYDPFALRTSHLVRLIVEYSVLRTWHADSDCPQQALDWGLLTIFRFSPLVNMTVRCPVLLTLNMHGTCALLENELRP